MSLGVESGFDTARVATASEREQAARNSRDAKALTLLRRRDAEDIAMMLGLLPAPPRRKKART